MGESTDRELWMLARDGDATSFGLLFDRHHRRVYKYAFRLAAYGARTHGGRL